MKASCPAAKAPRWNPESTLRELLEHELKQKFTRLFLLKDKTAAMGLLCVLAISLPDSIVLQCFERSKHFPSISRMQCPLHARSDKYHGWAVQKISFSYLQAAPEASEIYKFMNPHRMEV
jgi:hypothetical protein